MQLVDAAKRMFGVAATEGQTAINTSEPQEEANLKVQEFFYADDAVISCERFIINNAKAPTKTLACVFLNNNCP